MQPPIILLFFFLSEKDPHIIEDAKIYIFYAIPLALS